MREEFEDSVYLEKLWECYDKGASEKGLPKKELFIALIADLPEQLGVKQKEKDTIRHAHQQSAPEKTG